MKPTNDNSVTAVSERADILAVDPGTTKSAWAFFNPEAKRLSAGILPNAEMIDFMIEFPDALLVIEMIASYGMPVGAEVFETCVWIGRFEQAFLSRGGRVRKIYRKEVKLHLCGTPRANDAAIRQRLIDLYGEPGTKKQPGFTYGLKADMWAAFAVAVTASEIQHG